ncbi:MAG TPA: MBL fold metallo-hydrolase [Thermoanaerobaculia bacterium]|nr:MBL fold metallo-hydrolase [Thermoanaerobaculia bacterium]
MKRLALGTFFAAVAVLFAAAASALSAAPPVLRVTLLGTGNPRPAVRGGPAILVEGDGRALLFDAGRAAEEALFARDPALKIDALFLTHLHSDHTVGIPDVWLTGWLFGRAIPLRVFGPAGTAALCRGLQEAYAFDVHVRRDVDEKLPAAGARLDAREVSDGSVVDEGRLRVTAFAVDHGPVRPALGYRIDAGGRSVVLSGDTRPSENLVKFARGADVLVHEVIAPDAERGGAAASFSREQRERIIAHHSTPEQAGEIFAKVKPKLAVYSHVVPSFATAADLVAPTRRTYSGPLEVGEDGMTIEIGEAVRVIRPRR